MKKTLLCYGDSNTHGTKALITREKFERFGPETRWPSQLEQLLGDDWHIIEEGHPGRTTVHDDPIEGAHRNGLTILPAILESHRALDLVVLMLGTNDLKPRFSVTPMDISLSVERLIRVIQGAECGQDGNPPEIILVAPVPILETGVLKEIFEGGSAKSQELSVLYQLVAERTGCAFYDAGADAKVDPVDGVHLSAEAHTTISGGLHKIIRGIFP